MWLTSRLPLRGHPILLITGMITDQVRLHLVLVPWFVPLLLHRNENQDQSVDFHFMSYHALQKNHWRLNFLWYFFWFQAPCNTLSYQILNSPIRKAQTSGKKLQWAVQNHSSILLFQHAVTSILKNKKRDKIIHILKRKLCLFSQDSPLKSYDHAFQL